MLRRLHTIHPDMFLSPFYSWFDTRYNVTSGLLVLATALTPLGAYAELPQPTSQTTPSSPEASAPRQPLQHTELLLDAVVATIDDKPILLSELNSRFLPPKHLTLQEATHDGDAVKLLDALILEKLIEEEANAKKVIASEADVEEYINEVAARNSLTRPDFEKALENEKRSITDYKHQVRIEILRTKLASTMAKGGTSVTEAEIDEYLKEHPEISSSGPSLKLRQIVILAEKYPAETYRQRIESVMTAINKGDSFATVAELYSDGPHGKEGGLLGIISEKDLSPQVQAALANVKAGQNSRLLENENSAQLFFVEQRFSGVDEDDRDESMKALREEIRRALQTKSSQQKFTAFLTSELYKTHTVDKKI
jgi:peptidyl-prolyl cis-trans isomerase SurA